MEVASSQIQHHHKRWDVLILRQEMRELERERHHLSSKSLERPLSGWEKKRMETLLDDVMQLLQKFSQLDFQQQKAA